MLYFLLLHTYFLDTYRYLDIDFIDIDSDGDQDLFIGSSSGKLHYYNNIGTSTNFNFELVTDSYFDIDIGSRSSPDFIDIDSDNDYDLILGSYNQNLDIFRNIGDSSNPDFLFGI